MTNAEQEIKPEPDWKAIAMEIWDEYDMVGLFLENYFSNKGGCEFPFLEKMLPRRFKYFIRHRGRTLTKEEYDKAIEQQKLFTDSLYKSLANTHNTQP